VSTNQYVQIGNEQFRIAKPISGVYTTDSTTAGNQPVDTSGAGYSSITLYNGSGATVYYGSAGTTVANGMPLVANATATISSTDPRERVRLKDLFVTGNGTSGLAINWTAVG